MERIVRFHNDHEYLSNFFPVPREVLWGYPTVEHYYQGMKVDPEQAGCRAYRENIKSLTSSHSDTVKAKRLGQFPQMQVMGVHLRDTWEIGLKLEVMKMGLEAKFSVPHLARALVSTGDVVLVEGNFWHDNYWGDCSCSKCRDIPGQNHLGILLMEVRSALTS